jgi:NADH-quinone oxidoreductase subunit N
VLNGSFELLAKIFLILSVVPIFLVTLDSKKSLGTNTLIENVTLKLIILFSLLVIICANDTLILFFSLEIYALSSYVLVGQKGNTSIFSSEASLKYMILGTIFSLVLAYGIAVIYSCSGLTNFSDIAVFNSTNAENNLYWLFGLVLITTGLLFKISSAPFHF